MPEGLLMYRWSGNKKIPHDYIVRNFLSNCHTARVTLPERRQRVQTYTCLGLPLTIALTRFTLGFQGRLERR